MKTTVTEQRKTREERDAELEAAFEASRRRNLEAVKKNFDDMLHSRFDPGKSFSEG
ncbi:hypothetical protein [Rhizobium sp. BG4]|uniref:hypothetical protein n=1 Tax=Rhizobium sp. BG4 TaxID=2613770 RepID=UPI00193CEA22|nr:hypothetical protein [Rhizobium sp. BG4]